MSNKRILAKTILYRGIVIAILFVIIWVYTGNLTDTATITIIFNVLATIAYFFHEEIWDRIALSRTKQNLQRLSE